MDNPQEVKKVILAALVEKGDYKSILKHLSDEDKRGKETEKAEKLTKLITPISAFADLLTENSKGAFMEDLEARLDDTTAKGLTELSEAIEEAKTALQDELRSVLDASKAEMIEEHLARYSAAEGMLTEKLMAQAIETAAAKAEELLPSLKEGARLTEDEINDIIDAAALSVESQITDIIGEYIAEFSITPSQITGFAEAVRRLLPPERQVTWGEIVGKPEISQGGTNTNIVRALITEALANFSGGSSLPDQTGNAGKFLTTDGTDASWATLAGGGDMAAAVYDPANGARQVAFADSVATAAQGALADTASQPGHTHVAADVTDFDTEVSNNTDVAANTAARHTAVTVTDSAEIDFTLTGQNITASLIAGSIDETKLDASVNASLDLADSASQPGHTHTAANITDFNTEVSNNTDVAANTTARHAAVTVTDSSEINFTLTGQDITASLVASSIDETKLDASVNTSLNLADTALQAADVDDTPVNGATTDPISSNWAFDHAATAASDTAAGHVELAIASEVTTGTDATRAVTPDGLAGSNFGIKYAAVTLNSTTALTTSEKAYFRIPAAYTGMNLVSVAATVGTGAAGSSSSGTPTFTVKNVTDSNQMLSTSLTVDANEYTSATAATAAVIDTTKDDVVTDDLIEVAVTTAGTGVTYATITMGFQLP